MEKFQDALLLEFNKEKDNDFHLFHFVYYLYGILFTILTNLCFFSFNTSTFVICQLLFTSTESKHKCKANIEDTDMEAYIKDLVKKIRLSSSPSSITKPNN